MKNTSAILTRKRTIWAELEDNRDSVHTIPSGGASQTWNYANAFVVSDTTILDFILPCIQEALPKEPTPEKMDPAWKNYLGLYRNIWRDDRVLIQGNQLCLYGPKDEPPGSSLILLKPLGEHRFEVVSDDGYEEIGEEARFEIGADGKATRLWVGENYSDRVE